MTQAKSSSAQPQLFGLLLLVPVWDYSYALNILLGAVNFVAMGVAVVNTRGLWLCTQSLGRLQRRILV